MILAVINATYAVAKRKPEKIRLAIIVQIKNVYTVKHIQAPHSPRRNLCFPYTDICHLVSATMGMPKISRYWQLD